jgi:DNA polymerase-4
VIVERVIFHVDMDAFYASVEQADHPEFRGKPVIIGADPTKRGVVSACSYEARVFGIRSAMPIREAFARCREGIFLPVRMERYQEVSRKIMDLLGSFSPDILQISVDEAFLDMSGTRGLFGDPQDAARLIKQRVKAETGLTVSIGIAANRYLAKLASEYRKPDGLYRVIPGGEIAFLDSLPLKSLWGVGKKTLERLTELGISSVPQLRSFPEPTLRAMMGNAGGTYLYNACRGIDPGIYQDPKSHSVSNEITFDEDTRDEELIARTLLELSHQVMFRLLTDRARGKTVVLKLRTSDFVTTTAQISLRRPICSADEMFRLGKTLLEKRWDRRMPVRLVGIGISSVQGAGEPEQTELFPSADERKKRVEEAVLKIELENKGKPLLKASLLTPPAKTKGKSDAENHPDFDAQP